jgi:hypothetical protein
MTELNVEHVLLFVIVAVLLYHLIGGVVVANGFSVGGQGNESSNLFPFDKKYTDPRAKNICGYGYVKHLPHGEYSECNKDDGSLDASQECVCRKGNKVIKNNKNDPNLCMPANSEGSGRGTSYCYDKTDLQNIKDFFTGIVQTI